MASDSIFPPVSDRDADIAGGLTDAAQDASCEDGFCPMSSSPEDPKTPDVIEPNTMEALLREVIEEEDASDNEVVKELLRERLAEIRRLEDLLTNAKRQLNELMAKDPKDIAHSAAISPDMRWLRQAANCVASHQSRLLTGKNAVVSIKHDWR